MARPAVSASASGRVPEPTGAPPQRRPSRRRRVVARHVHAGTGERLAPAGAGHRRTIGAVAQLRAQAWKQGNSCRRGIGTGAASAPRRRPAHARPQRPATAPAIARAAWRGAPRGGRRGDRRGLRTDAGATIAAARRTGTGSAGQSAAVAISDRPADVVAGRGRTQDPDARAGPGAARRSRRGPEGGTGGCGAAPAAAGAPVRRRGPTGRRADAGAFGSVVVAGRGRTQDRGARPVRALRADPGAARRAAMAVAVRRPRRRARRSGDADQQGGRRTPAPSDQSSSLSISSA
jgi:hypothetical protein